jgi:hypothetical protein
LTGILKGASPLIRVFALFAFLFGLAYLAEGVPRLIAFAPGRDSFLILQVQLAIILLDLLIGVASIFIGVGLAFRKEWARKAWLILLILTLLVHFFMTATQFFARYSGLTTVYEWIGMVIFVSLISLIYLSKADVRAGFN